VEGLTVATSSEVSVDGDGSSEAETNEGEEEDSVEIHFEMVVVDFGCSVFCMRVEVERRWRLEIAGW
jgi:hypothetical protein